MLHDTVQMYTLCMPRCLQVWSISLTVQLCVPTTLVVHFLTFAISFLKNVSNCFSPVFALREDSVGRTGQECVDNTLVRVV